MIVATTRTADEITAIAKAAVREHLANRHAGDIRYCWAAMCKDAVDRVDGLRDVVHGDHW